MVQSKEMTFETLWDVVKLRLEWMSISTWEEEKNRYMFLVAYCNGHNDYVLLYFVLLPFVHIWLHLMQSLFLNEMVEETRWTKPVYQRQYYYYYYESSWKKADPVSMTTSTSLRQQALPMECMNIN